MRLKVSAVKVASLHVMAEAERWPQAQEERPKRREFGFVVATSFAAESHHSFIQDKM
jgi:hypothetical protein